MLEEDLPLLVIVRADLDALARKASQIPFAIPERRIRLRLHPLGHGRVLLDVRAAAQMSGGLQEGIDRPDVQEGDEGSLTAAEIETVVPVRAQALADAIGSDLL